MQLLVTGATGFIGQHVCRRLLDAGHFIRALVRDASGLGALGHRVTPFIGDLTAPASLEGVEESVDAVIHLAALGHVSAISEAAFARFRQVNVEGTHNLLRRFHGREISRLVHVSSTAAMGLVKAPIVSEAHQPQPATPYQRSKRESELAALSHATDHGLPVCVVRPCMVYGVGGEGELLKQARLIKRGAFPRVGLGENLTPLVHVHDVARGLIGALERGRPGATYLMCGADSMPLAELRAIIIEAMGRGPRLFPYVPGWAMRLGAQVVEQVAARTGQTPIVTRRNIENTLYDRRFDIGLARRELGYDPQVSPREGVTETVRWWMQTGRL